MTPQAPEYQDARAVPTDKLPRMSVAQVMAGTGGAGLTLRDLGLDASLGEASGQQQHQTVAASKSEEAGDESKRQHVLSLDSVLIGDEIDPFALPDEEEEEEEEEEEGGEGGEGGEGEGGQERDVRGKPGAAGESTVDSGAPLERAEQQQQLADLDDLLLTKGSKWEREVAAARKVDPNREMWAVREPLPDSIMKNFKEHVPKMAHEFPFELDVWQKEAVYHLEQGDSIFVSAHTSAGKTVTAEYAIGLAFQHRTKYVCNSESLHANFRCLWSLAHLSAPTQSQSSRILLGPRNPSHFRESSRNLASCSPRINLLSIFTMHSEGQSRRLFQNDHRLVNKVLTICFSQFFQCAPQGAYTRRRSRRSPTKSFATLKTHFPTLASLPVTCRSIRLLRA
jgi:hypothetical protein